MHIFLFITAFIASIFSNAIQAENKSSVDNEIQRLEEELHSYRTDGLNKEMHAQQYMFDNWHNFAEQLSQHEEDEKNITTIKEQLKTLYEQKKNLDTKASPL